MPQPLDGGVEAVAIDDVSASGLPTRSQAIPIGEELHDGIGEGVAISDRHRAGGRLEIRDDADASTHGGAATGGGLLGDSLLRFVQGRQNAQVGRPVVLGQLVVGHVAVEAQLLRHAELRSQAREWVAQRAVAHDVLIVRF